MINGTKEFTAEVIKKDIAVVSEGLTGPEWIVRLETRGISIPEGFKHYLKSDKYIPDQKGIVTKIAAFSGADLVKEFGASINVAFDVPGSQSKPLSIDAALLFTDLLAVNPEMDLGEIIYLQHRPYSLPELENLGHAYVLNIGFTANTKKISLQENSADFKFYSNANYAIAFE